MNDELAGASTTPEASSREPFLLQLIGQFEGGQLDAYEYQRRVGALERATSIEEMQQIVDTPGSVVVDARHGAAGDGSARPALDPVDLARLAAPVSGRKAVNPKTRYVTLIVVIVALIIALAVGIWLASRVHTPKNSSDTVSVVTASGVAHGNAVAGPMARYASGSSPDPSPRSPRR